MRKLTVIFIVLSVFVLNLNPAEGDPERVLKRFNGWVGDKYVIKHKTISEKTKKAASDCMLLPENSFLVYTTEQVNKDFATKNWVKGIYDEFNPKIEGNKNSIATMEDNLRTAKSTIENNLASRFKELLEKHYDKITKGEFMQDIEEKIKKEVAAVKEQIKNELINDPNFRKELIDGMLKKYKEGGGDE